MAAKKKPKAPAERELPNENAPLQERFAVLCAAQPTALPLRYEDKKATSSWTVGRKKVFATWVFEGDEIGPHLRSNDPAVREDPRVKPTSTPTAQMEKTNNFVWLDPGAAWSNDELEKLLVASHSLSSRKDGGIKRGGSYGDLFIVLRKALLAAPEDMRTAPPHHAGGPAAKILGNEGPTSRAMAVWLAKLLAPLASEDEAPHVKKSLELAEAERAKYDALWSAAYDKGGSRALRAARFAQLAHGSMAGGYETRASSYAADIAVLVIEQWLEDGVADRPHTKQKVRDLLEEIDDRILNAELAAVARDKLGREGVQCERVLWRGTDAKGNAGRWIARMEAGVYVMITKVGPRWQWIEGPRDHVLASVPDDDFEAATQIAIDRDQPGAFGVGAVVTNPRWAWD